MGMDMNMYRARNAAAIDKYLEAWNFNDDPAYDHYIDGTEEDTFPVVEIYYSRKFWDLFEAMSFTNNYQCGAYLRLTKANVKEMLDYSATHPDYFGDFETVKNLCYIYYKFDEWEARGLHVFFECDW